MSGLSEHFPEFQFGGAQVSPSNIDRYELYQIINPMIGTDVIGTAEGTSTTTATGGFAPIIPDYPRSVSVKILPASGSTSGGTVTLVGKDQFGNVQSESFGFAAAADGGTANGTLVWGAFTSFTTKMASGNAGIGTTTIYPTALGTTALFGLPAKIGGSTDVRLISFGSTGVAKIVNGGTLGAYVNVARSAITAPNTLTTGAANATWINVWYKPSWSNAQKANMASL